MVADIKQLVDSQINSNKLIIYLKPSCPYCIKAVKALDEVAGEGNYKIVDLTAEERMKEYQDYLQTLTGARTVPRVFLAGEFIGGGDDIVALKKQNKLSQIFEDAGIGA